MANDVARIGVSLVPPMWNMSQSGIDAINRIKTRNDRSGVMRYYSALPMKCAGIEQCIYKESCYLEKMNIDENIGEVCPIEVELILSYFQRYVEEFGLEDINDPKNTTVIGLLKDLIDMELQIERANKRLREDGDYLEDRVIAVTESGQKVTNKEINQHINFKMKMQEKKAQILNLLHATPKDKAKKEETRSFDPSTYAKEILAKAREAGIELNAVEVTDTTVVEDSDSNA